MLLPDLERGSPLHTAFEPARKTMPWVFVFSGVINLLGLTGSIYMIQVYDRVLSSRSLPTLALLTVLVLALFTLSGALEIVRARVLARLAAGVEQALLKPVHAMVLSLASAGRNAVESIQPLRDVEALRTFVASAAPGALCDLPFVPLYLFFVFALHPVLGILSVVGLAAMVGLSLLNERQLRQPSQLLGAHTANRQEVSESHRRHVEILRAMGMGPMAERRFLEASGTLLGTTLLVADKAGFYANIARSFRVLFQSLMLGAGAYLVIRNEMSGGAIIAGSILSGRSMAPVDTIIANWKLIAVARTSLRRLGGSLGRADSAPAPLDLPLAHQKLEVRDLAVVPPGQRAPTVQGVTFALNKGDGLVILGPSGAGKSSLLRALVGAWPAVRGTVRLDGAPLEQWPTASLNKLIGYLPQTVDLFEGTIAQNIARLDPAAKDADIVAAAKAAQCHALVLHFPEGYQTRLSEGGANLSAGQRQRIGLARALYGNPFLVVLDEPNAHLDPDGDAALAQAIVAVRKRGGIVVVVAHHGGILGSVNLAAVVAEGAIKALGPRDEVLSRLEKAMRGRGPGGAPPAPAPQNTGATP